MILDYDTNTIYLSKRFVASSRGMEVLEYIVENGIDIQLIEGTRDIWARDYMPIQVAENIFIGYEYVPNYLYYEEYCHTITNQARVCDQMHIDTIPSGIILDGGNVVKTSKCVIMVDKIFHENGRLSKIDLINRLENLFQSEIIFLPWDRAEIYGHADGIVREYAPGKVVMTNYHRYSRRLAEKFQQILAQKFDVEILDYEVKKQHPHNWCYINYLHVGDKVFLPQLSDWRPRFPREAAPGCGGQSHHKDVEEDLISIELFKNLMPNYEIIPVYCSKIVRDGGALNCISWNIKR